MPTVQALTTYTIAMNRTEVEWLAGYLRSVVRAQGLREQLIHIAEAIKGTGWAFRTGGQFRITITWELCLFLRDTLQNNMSGEKETGDQGRHREAFFCAIADGMGRPEVADMINNGGSDDDDIPF